MFIEPNEPGGPFEVSDADTMLPYIDCIDPKAKEPAQVEIFTREGCQCCARAETLLSGPGYACADVAPSHTARRRIVGAVTGE
ncbi:MAG: Hybrid peroxiredoxin hyPrx5 [Gammaproteobacteria bacterium]|nr:Hybrid peroxiredoxin hyPrx5 [Gammaproteobacteria bacterium]